VLGGGATLAGAILGAITVYIIEREFNKAAAFALAGMVFTFFGFIHGEAIGVAKSLEVSASYLLVAGLLVWVGNFGTFSAPVKEMHHEEGIDAHGMPTAAAE
jgi:adenine/guanine/hypoxanthine permease